MENKNLCNKRKQGEHNMLRCFLPLNHKGYCCFVVDPIERLKDIKLAKEEVNKSKLHFGN